jgi:hypothetical protein
MRGERALAIVQVSSVNVCFRGGFGLGPFAIVLRHKSNRSSLCAWPDGKGATIVIRHSLAELRQPVAVPAE